MNYEADPIEIQAIIDQNSYQVRRAKRQYLAYTAGRAIKWTVIGFGVVAIASYVTKDKDKNEEEN